MARFKTHYMDKAVFNLPEVIESCRLALRGVDFDTIVGTGFSGGIVIPALALTMNKDFVLIRKETDDSHHGQGMLVGQLGERWVFVDDFVSSGRTRSRVIEKIDGALTAGAQPAEMVGQYLYQNEMGFEPYSPTWAPEKPKTETKSSGCTCSLCTAVREGEL